MGLNVCDSNYEKLLNRYFFDGKGKNQCWWTNLQKFTKRPVWGYKVVAWALPQEAGRILFDVASRVESIIDYY